VKCMRCRGAGAGSTIPPEAARIAAPSTCIRSQRGHVFEQTCWTRTTPTQVAVATPLHFQFKASELVRTLPLAEAPADRDRLGDGAASAAGPASPSVAASPNTAAWSRATAAV
jgi:hypothetical protein